MWDAIAFFDSLDSFIKDKPSLSDLRFRDRIQSIVMNFVTGQEYNEGNAGNEQQQQENKLDDKKKSDRDNEGRQHHAVKQEKRELKSEAAAGEGVKSGGKSLDASRTTSKVNVKNTRMENEMNRNPSMKSNFLWKPVPLEVALIGSVNVSLVSSSFREDQCAFWQQQGLLDYVWVS